MYLHVSNWKFSREKSISKYSLPTFTYKSIIYSMIRLQSAKAIQYFSLASRPTNINPLFLLSALWYYHGNYFTVTACLSAVPPMNYLRCSCRLTLHNLGLLQLVMQDFVLVLWAVLHITEMKKSSKQIWIYHSCRKRA